MKILMTADAVGGVWTYALQLAGQLRRAEVEVILATMGRLPSADQSREAKSCANLTLCSSEFALEWMKDPWDDVDRAALWLLELEQRYQPDVIHLNGYAHAALPWRAPKLVVCHSCVLSWWLAVNSCHAPTDEWLPYRLRVEQGLRAADCVIAPSASMLSSIRNIYGELSCPSGVIANAVDASLYEPAPKEPYIFSAGRLWDPAKNVRALVLAGEELAWPVYLAGEADGANDAVGKGRFSANVGFLGQLSSVRMASLLRAAAIYCLPARYEPFGLSVLEAGHAQCALVLGDIPSLRENWDGAALFVSPDDVNGLAAVLEELSANSTLREDYAQRARNRARVFSPETFFTNYLNVYQLLSRAHVSDSFSAWENPQCAS